MGTSLDVETRPIRYRSGVYAEWFIKSVIAELEGGTARQEILLRYNLKPNTVDYWIDRYASSEYKNKRKKVTDQLRRSVVRSILSGRMTIEEAKLACRIKTAETIRIWISDYQQQENSDLAVTNQLELGKKKSNSKISSEQEQIKILQQQLADEKLKVAALNTLIDIAEEQLKINIRKKPGARQS